MARVQRVVGFILSDLWSWLVSPDLFPVLITLKYRRADFCLTDKSYAVDGSSH